MGMTSCLEYIPFPDGFLSPGDYTGTVLESDSPTLMYSSPARFPLGQVVLQ